MACPYLEEVAMLFCRAYPVKKPLPRDRVAIASPCLGEGFARCPFYQERLPATTAGRQERSGARAVKTRKESSS